LFNYLWQALKQFNKKDLSPLAKTSQDDQQGFFCGLKSCKVNKIFKTIAKLRLD
jgi:hypothetical protein